MTESSVVKNAGDTDLRRHAERFLVAFSESAGKGQSSLTEMVDRAGFSAGAGGVVEFTEEIVDSLSSFITRATSLLGSKAGHENAIRQIAIAQAHLYVAEGAAVPAAVASLIAEVLKNAGAVFEYVAPNHLVQLADGVRELVIGRVRTLRTSDYAAERAATRGHERVEIREGGQFRLTMSDGRAEIQMPPFCWIVGVDAAPENVDEEAKWLIDVATSFLRIVCQPVDATFRRLGAREAHPTRMTTGRNESVKFADSKVLLGGATLPLAYRITSLTHGTLTEKSCAEMADLVLRPPNGSLAQRVHQGLGWMTRGRQAEDRAERLLYFFTAIESLLSTDDKTAPVVQNIARSAAVILTDDNAARAEAAATIKKLYGIRSSLVHSGARSTPWSAANSSEALVEALYANVLTKADLRLSHMKFCDGLSAATYGTVWPAVTTKAQPPSI